MKLFKVSFHRDPALREKEGLPCGRRIRVVPRSIGSRPCLTNRAGAFLVSAVAFYERGWFCVESDLSDLRVKPVQEPKKRTRTTQKNTGK